MTKAELLAAISSLPDDSKVLEEPWPEGGRNRGLSPGSWSLSPSSKRSKNWKRTVRHSQPSGPRVRGADEFMG